MHFDLVCCVVELDVVCVAVLERVSYGLLEVASDQSRRTRVDADQIHLADATLQWFFFLDIQIETYESLLEAAR